MVDELTKPIQILSVGRKQCNDGRWFDFSGADLTAMQAAFDGAPMVPGHPPDDQPVGAVAKAVSVAGNVLQVTEYSDVDPMFAAFVNRTAANRCSVKIRLPDHPDNPFCTYQIRHIGFLDNPADQALEPAEFAQCEAHEAIFSEIPTPSNSGSESKGSQGGGKSAPSPSAIAAQLSQSTEAQLMKTLGETLTEALAVQQGMTVADLAQAIGMDESALQSVLAGETLTLSDDALQALAAALGLSFDDLKAMIPVAESVSAADAGMSAPARDAELSVRVAALEKREAEFARAQAIGPWLEDQIQAGRLLPGEKAQFVALFSQLDASQEISFSRGTETVKQPATTLLKTFIGTLPRRGPTYGEISPDKGEEAAFGALKDPIQIAKRIKAYRDKHPRLSYADAANALKAGV